MGTHIVQATAIPYRARLRTAMTSALGEQRWSEFGLVRLWLADGTEGLGEISLIWHGNGARHCDIVNEVVAPAIVGTDVFDYSTVMGAVRQALAFGRHSLTVAAAIEMALLDAQGKLLGQPVVNLLGGVAVDRVPLSMSLSIATVDRCLEQARGYVDSGFTTLKVKGTRDHHQMAEIVAALRRTFGPDLGLRVDLNMACRSAKEALQAVRRLEPFGVLSVEQPLPPDDHAGLALLRQHSALPIMLDESVWGPEDAVRVLERGAADLINVYVAEAGGIRPAKLIADLAGLHHVGIAIGSMPETGTGTAAAAHLAFSLPDLEHPSDVAGMLYHAEDVVTTSLEISDGYVCPPTRPGLGIELDEDRLDACTIR